MARPDYYAVLGVDKDAGPETIKRAYRRLALECHPDRFPGDADAEARFRRVSEAYSVLGDVEKRAQYDRAGLLPQTYEMATAGGFKISPSELFNSVFGDVFGSRRNNRRRGRDLRYTLTVDFEEAVLGSTHEITFEALGSCSTCKGTGTRPGGRAARPCSHCDGRGEVKGSGLFARRTTCGRCDGLGMLHLDPCEDCRGQSRRREQRVFTVRLPPATDAGAERVLRGQGEPGRFGGESGDLRVTVNLRPHAWLTRKEQDVLLELPVSPTQLVVGDKVDVPTVDGWATLDLPAGVKAGASLRMRGKGVPGAKGGRGDQLVRLRVELPSAVSPRLSAALEELEAALEADPEAMPRRHALRQASCADSAED
jgi:molecular chaperone DnaJ